MFRFFFADAAAWRACLNVALRNPFRAQAPKIHAVAAAGHPAGELA
jgi:hypothetical protein